MNDWPEPNANELTEYSMAWELSDKDDEIAQLKAQLDLRQTAAVSVNATTPPAPPVADTAPAAPTPSPVVVIDAKPWLLVDPRDPTPEQPWYTPARYFARQLVVADSTLLTKRLVLADKVSTSLVVAGIYKRGGKKPHSADTVLKAFANVTLG